MNLPLRFTTMIHSMKKTQPVPQQTESVTDDQPLTPDAADKPKPQQNKFIIVLVVLIALIAGIAGLILNRSSDTSPATTIKPEITPLFLSLTSPKDLAGAVEGEVLVSGKTLPDTTVAIYSDMDDSTVVSDADGMFESTVVVGESGGLIRVSAFSDSGEEKTETILVGEEITQVLGVLAKSDNSPGQLKKENSTGTKRANVVAAEKNTDSKTEANKPMVNTTAKPTKAATQGVAASRSKEVKDFKQNKPLGIKQEKIGAGKIKEMLTLDSTQSGAPGKLKHFKVQEASQAAVMKRHAVSGVITQLGAGTLTIAHQIQTDRTTVILFNANTIITGKSDAASGSGQLQTGVRITAVGIPSAEGLLATRIHIIPGRAIGVFNKFPVATDDGEFITGTPSAAATPTATLMPTETPEATESVTPTLTNTPSP